MANGCDVDCTGLEALFRDGSQSPGCRALPACVDLRRGLPSVQCPLPSLSEHLSPRVDHVLLWVAEWPLGGPGQ